MSSPAANHIALANAVLKCPQGPERDQIVDLLQPELYRHAQIHLNHLPELGAYGDANDLVQEFLSAKILPREKLIKALRPVASGERQLIPRVLCAFRNFLKSMLRTRRPPRPAPFGSGEGEIDPVDRPAWDSFKEHVAEQCAVIRRLFPLDAAGVPYGLALRLQERFDWAFSIVDAFNPGDGVTCGNQTVAEVVEHITLWNSEEGSQRFPPQGITLDQAWREVRQRTQDRPDKACKSLMAAILGISPNLWLQWVSRGRRRLVEQLDAGRAGELFNHWPSSVFDRAREGRGER